MTQKMSSGVLKAVTYYRKQKLVHPSHEESGGFTADAVTAYATLRGIDEDQVEKGTYQSGQGVPQYGEEI